MGSTACAILSSTTSGSASLMSVRIRASISPRQSPKASIFPSISSNNFVIASPAVLVTPNGNLEPVFSP